jgi:S1 RNA binding domain protein
MKKLTSDTQPLLKVGDVIEAEVYKITTFGAFVKLPYYKKGLIHISQIADGFVKNISEHLKIGDRVKARVIVVDGDKIDLTLKKEYFSSYPKDKDFKATNLAEKLNTLFKSNKGSMRGGAAR